MGVVRGLGSAAFAAALVVLGCWVTGGLLTDDATTAMVLTGAWFTVAMAAALLAARRWGRAAWPALGATAVTASIVGGWLLLTSQVDKVVHEQVLAVPTSSSAAAPGLEPAPAAATQVAAGSFTSGAHETRGRATVLRRADGRLLLTLTDFETDAGPDLRVRLVPAGAKGVDGGTDIGALKGNKGDQQYAVPAGAPTGRVVIWCRAFSVSFGAAHLRA